MVVRWRFMLRAHMRILLAVSCLGIYYLLLRCALTLRVTRSAH